MKDKKAIILSNKIKEIIIKTLIILSLVLVLGFISSVFIMAFTKTFEKYTFLSLGIFFGGSILNLIIIFTLGSTLKEVETPNKDYKIKSYECLLQEDIEDRFVSLYKEVIKYTKNEKWFYSFYRKEFETVVIAFMEVDNLFDENMYIDFMTEIPQLNEQVLNHTLIVIFKECEKSKYVKEIMCCAEYNSLYDTKVFSVYDEVTNKLKVNKTNSGTGNKAYNDVRKELNKIFIFKPKEKKSHQNSSIND